MLLFSFLLFVTVFLEPRSSQVFFFFFVVYRFILFYLVQLIRSICKLFLFLAENITLYYSKINLILNTANVSGHSKDFSTISTKNFSL